MSSFFLVYRDSSKIRRFGFTKPKVYGTFFFKGHSQLQLAHMRIRYYFIANLHITETRSTLLLTKYDKKKL